MVGNKMEWESLDTNMMSLLMPSHVNKKENVCLGKGLTLWDLIWEMNSRSQQSLPFRLGGRNWDKWNFAKKIWRKRFISLSCPLIRASAVPTLSCHAMHKCGHENCAQKKCTCQMFHFAHKKITSGLTRHGKCPKFYPSGIFHFLYQKVRELHQFQISM